MAKRKKKRTVKLGRPKQKPDTINSPPHYTKGQFETIEIIDDIIQFYPPVEAHYAAQVIRYLARAPHKGKVEADLMKARWYLNRLIDHPLFR